METAMVGKPMLRNSPTISNHTETRGREENSVRPLKRRDTLPETTLHGCSELERRRDLLDHQLTRDQLESFHHALLVFL